MGLSRCPPTPRRRSPASTTRESLNGFYLHHRVQTLFRLVREGFDVTGGDLLARGGARSHGFSIRPLDSRLFRSDAMPLLDRVKLRNRVLQRVIRLMSLSRPATRRITDDTLPGGPVERTIEYLAPFDCPDCVQIFLRVDAFSLKWPGIVSGVTLPSGFMRLMET